MHIKSHQNSPRLGKQSAAHLANSTTRHTRLSPSICKHALFSKTRLGRQRSHLFDLSLLARIPAPYLTAKGQVHPSAAPTPAPQGRSPLYITTLNLQLPTRVSGPSGSRPRLLPESTKSRFMSSGSSFAIPSRQGVGNALGTRCFLFRPLYRAKGGPPRPMDLSMVLWCIYIIRPTLHPPGK
ncbi:hypothetical protein BKA81DRAFT_74162 [Phyllosticta paracitricarpa]